MSRRTQTSDDEDAEAAWPSLSARTGLPPVVDHLARLGIQIVDSSGVIETVEAWKREERKSTGGRPETFPTRAVVVAMVLCALIERPLLATCFRDILFFQLSPEIRRELGVPDPPDPSDRRGVLAIYRNVRTRFHGLMSLMDPSSAPKNRRLDHEAFVSQEAARRAMRSEQEWAERERRLAWFNINCSRRACG